MPEPHSTPSWAQQSGPNDTSPTATDTQPNPTKTKHDKKDTCLGCGCLGFLATALIFGVAALVGGGSSHSTVASTPSPAPSHTTASPAATAASSAPATHSNSAQTPAAAHCDATSPAAARAKAAGILHANDAYYQQEFNDGVTVVLDRGSDNSFPAFHAWYEKAATDVQPGMDAFKQADACFTADDEPAAISDWRDDNGNLSADIAQLASDGLGVGGPEDATWRQKVQDDARKFPHDFQVAETDADKVAGKRN